MNGLTSFGVYCLANDAMLEWMIAFLKSLRTVDPTRELVVIPYDSNVAKLSKLAAKYQFRLLADDALEHLDKLGARIGVKGDKTWHHAFRKLAAFWGPFDHFLFLDADIVVLGRLDELERAFLSSECDFLYFDANMETAYRPGAFRARMIKEHSSVGFNSGAFVSSKGLFSMEEIERLAGDATGLRDSYVSNGEQSFFNYIVDVKGLRKCRYCELVSSASCSNWANLRPVSFFEGAYVLRNPDHGDVGTRLLFLHWAGFKLGPLMPHRSLFLKFRHKGRSQVALFAHYALEPVRLLQVLVQTLARKARLRLSHPE